MKKEYFKEFDYTDIVKNDYVTVKLSPKGRPKRFDLSYLLDTLVEHYTQLGIPFAYAMCTANSGTGSTYKYDCNLPKLKYTLTDDHFLKTGLYEKPGKKKISFNYTDLYKSDEKTLIALETIDGHTEKITMSVLVLMITRHIMIHDIPFFYAACTINNDAMSLFVGTCLFYGLDYQLKDDWFRKFYLTELGVTDEPPRVLITTTEEDDSFDDFDDEEE